MTAESSATVASRPFEPGTFTATIRSLPHRLELAADGTWKVFRDDALFQNGTYRLAGQSIEFTDEGGPPAACAPKDEPGVYTWTYDGKNLKLERDKDTCPGRNADTPRTWIRQ